MDKELEVRLQFLEEAQEYLDTLEAVVLGLSATGVDPKKMDGALRAAHSIKGGAALMQFQLLSHTAHRLEDCLKILQARRPQVGEELENLLLSALDSIRQIVENSREGNDAQAIAQSASLTFDQLQDILGELQPEDETALASQESGHDLVKLFFESEVENNLLRLEEVLATPGQPCLESELSVLAQELGGLGEMLQLSNFSSLCLSVSQYLETYPAQVEPIATLALSTWRQAQDLVLIGQRELIPSVLDYRPSAVPDTSDLTPAADTTQRSELELLLAGFEEEPIALLSETEFEPGMQPELALESWPGLESLLFEVEPEATTAEIAEPSPTQPKTEADLGIEALLIGLDLDLFQELETASPVKPAAFVPEHEWADLDSLFAEIEGEIEIPTGQKPAELPSITAEAKIEPKERELTAELHELDSLANLLDFEAAPVVLEEAKALPLAISEPEELTSESSEETGLGMLAAIFDIGVESAPSEPITLAEEEVHTEVEAQFLEVFDIEAAAPVLPEVLEVGPVGVVAHEIAQDFVAETVLEAEPTEAPFLAAEVRTIQWSDLEAFIAASEESLEASPPGPPTTLQEAARSASNGGEASLASSEILDADSMGDLFAMFPTLSENLQDGEFSEFGVETVQESFLEHEFRQELIAEEQEVFMLDEQPMVLAEASAIEPPVLDVIAEHEIIEVPVAEEMLEVEQSAEESNPWSEIAAFVKVSVVPAVAIDAVEIEGPPSPPTLGGEAPLVSAEIMDADVDGLRPTIFSSAFSENLGYEEFSEFGAESVQEDVLAYEFRPELVAAEDQEVFTLDEQPMVSAEAFVSEAPVNVIELHVLDVIAEPEVVEEQAYETIQFAEQPLLLSEVSVSAASTQQAVSEAPVNGIDLEPQTFDIAVEPEIIETFVAEEILDAEQSAEESNPWSEIAAFVQISAVTAVSATVIGAMETEQPVVLAETSVSEAPGRVIEPPVLDVIAEPEIIEPFVAEEMLEAEQSVDESNPWSEIVAFVQVSTVTAVSAAAVDATTEAESVTLNSEHAPAEQLPLMSEVASLPAIAEVEPIQEMVEEEPVLFVPPILPALMVAAMETSSDILEKSILPKKIENASSNSEANTVRIPAKRLDQLDDLCGDLTIERNGLALYLERLHSLVAGLNGRVRNLEQFNLRLRSAYDQEAQANTPVLSSPSSLTEENFDALEMDRYSELHLVWQEVMESIVQIQEVTSDIDLTVRSADDTAAELNRTAKELQSNVMYSRMRPLTDVVGRFPRAIRDLAQQFGKPATLKIHGGSTLIDRTVLGILGDPLMHLLRNAFDHGLEDSETRIAKGKTAHGTIEIKALYRGNETIITVSDDGGGINLDKIRDKAIRLGFDQDQLTQARPQDLLDLIFEPGFSTADQVTELSGRGVGMDVVRTNLQQVRGKITVNTQPGIGTTFTLSVPVTLSVGRVLLVESQNVMLAFPVDAIEQMALLEEDDDHNADIFQWENYAVPKLALKEWLSFRGPVRKIETDDMAMMANPAMLILSQGNDLVGVPIDRCWGEREVAIRQAEGPIPMPPGFSGCTILGTGQVVPLVSIPGLFNWIADQGRASKTAAPIQFTASQVQKERESILVIDDSINVRRFLAMTLEKAGYRVAQAKDGQDAIEQLTSGLLVNAIICDIEMPRLDGFGFLAQAKANPALQHLPITMLTSRSGDKHRQLALRLGASEYFSKPFKEQELLQALRQLIQSTHLTPTS
jgi:chemotaxis protein histidine kinase CheA/ActR/RegA family two-component response regulator